MSCTIRPLSRATATADSRVPSAVAFESQTRSSQMTGDDQALPGIAVFQATPLDSLHSTGRLCSCETPSPVTPRNSGHGVAAHAWFVRTGIASHAPVTQQPTAKARRRRASRTIQIRSGAVSIVMHSGGACRWRVAVHDKKRATRAPCRHRESLPPWDAPGWPVWNVSTYTRSATEPSLVQNRALMA